MHRNPVGIVPKILHIHGAFGIRNGNAVDFRRIAGLPSHIGARTQAKYQKNRNYEPHNIRLFSKYKAARKFL